MKLSKKVSRAMAVTRSIDGSPFELSRSPLRSLSDTWSSLRPQLKTAIYALLFFALLYARRSAELFHPEVWDEERSIISDFVLRGFSSVVQPINGYLLVIPRILSITALFASLSVYPTVVTIFTWIATIGMLLLIASVPSRLHARPVLVVVALLVPTDAEVFGLPLYTFWWSGLLLMAAAFWSISPRYAWWYAALVAICGASSPIILLVAPVYLVVAIKWPNRASVYAATAAMGTAVVQFIELVSADFDRNKSSVSFVTVAEKFIGGYVSWNLSSGLVQESVSLFLAVAIVGLFIFTITNDRSERFTVALLLYIWLGSMAFSLARVDVAVLEPDFAGPRYFFYPYALEGWILVQILVASTNRFSKIFALLLVIGSVANALPSLSRSHDDLAWGTAVSACDTAPDGEIINLPVEYDGHASTKWTLPIAARACRELYRLGALGLLQH